ncbi:MAG TPA: hypothetical protein EYH06_01375 [Chromatiales bacterium]|nr:hypothetical protein [Thiotrichales bacterium]HIP67225.1 hypothetical protein [Chromatiales bacterium]
MKGQTSKSIIRHAQQGILICLFFGVVIPAFAGPYVDYGVSNLLENSQATRQFNQRFGFSSSLYHDDIIASSFFELQREIDTVSLLSDWYPRHGLFRLSAGVLYQPEDIKQKQHKQPFQLPLLLPNIETGFSGLSTDGVSPYVGLGWGNNQWQGSKLGFNVDMGVLYQPDERLLDNKAVDAYRENTKPSANNFLRSLEDLELSPVFSLGVSYNF